MVDRLSNGVFISEILADNAGGSAIDTDNDGKTSKADEYVELQNYTGSPVSLNGIQIWSEKNGLLFSFGPGDSLAAGGTATVLGEYTGTPPAGFYSAGDKTNDNFLLDGEGSQFDTIFVLDTNSDTFISFSYGDPPRVPTEPAGFPSGATRVGSGEALDSNAPNGTAFSRNAHGEFVESPPSPGQPGVLCIANGSRIETILGPVLVEDLRPGDLLRCHDGETRPLRAVGRSRLGTRVWRACPMLGPVDLLTENGRRGLSLSPNHRVLRDGAGIELLLGAPEVLVPAKFLGRPRRQKPGESVDYFHLIFEDHALIQAEGLWIESLYLGDVGRSWVAQQRAAGTLVEQAADLTDAIRHTGAALPCVKSYEALALQESAVAA